MSKFDVNWGGSTYPMYDGEMKSGPTQAEKQGYTNSTADQNAATTDASNANSEVSTATTNPTASPLYQTLLTSSTDATNDAYNNAKAATNMHANMSGFGYSSPIGQAADTGVDTARAGDLSKLPGQAMLANLNQANTDAARLDKQSGTEFSAGGKALDTASAANESRIARNNMLWQSLANLGVQGATMGMKAAGV